MFLIENGGEDRTRTCKRLRAVVFKTTALPIRLPLRTRRGELEILTDYSRDRQTSVLKDTHLHDSVDRLDKILR